MACWRATAWNTYFRRASLPPRGLEPPALWAVTGLRPALTANGPWDLRPIRYSNNIGRHQLPPTVNPSPNPTMSLVVTNDGSMYNSPEHLLLFGQINLAKCAAERAQMSSFEIDPDGSDRFGREYDTARMWTHHAQIIR